MSGSTNDEIQPQDQKHDIDQDTWMIRLQRPIRREGSGRYLVVVLVGFVISVTLTRLFLSLTSYIQLGSGEIHISHILWGGLFLFLATLLLLLFSNRQVYKVTAILSGVGMGLFIDEVGKFVTQQNDYFYPLAAPIIYIFFMLFLILVIRLRRQMKSTPRSEFSRAMETLQDWVDHPLNSKDQAVMLARLKDASTHANPHLASLASSVLEVVQQDSRPLPVERLSRWEFYVKKLDQWFSERGLRLILAVAFLLMAVIAFKNPASDLLNSRLPDFWGSSLFSAHSGRWLASESAPGFYQARVTLEIVLGCLLLMNSLLLFYKKTRLGIPLGFGIMILHITAINTLLFYFEQFSTIGYVFFQFLLLTGLIYYRTHFLNGNKQASEENKQDIPV